MTTDLYVNVDGTPKRIKKLYVMQPYNYSYTTEKNGKMTRTSQTRYEYVDFPNTENWTITGEARLTLNSGIGVNERSIDTGSLTHSDSLGIGIISNTYWAVWTKEGEDHVGSTVGSTSESSLTDWFNFTIQRTGDTCSVTSDYVSWSGSTPDWLKTRTRIAYGYIAEGSNTSDTRVSSRNVSIVTDSTPTLLSKLYNRDKRLIYTTYNWEDTATTDRISEYTAIVEVGRMTYNPTWNSTGKYYNMEVKKTSGAADLFHFYPSTVKENAPINNSEGWKASFQVKNSPTAVYPYPRITCYKSNGESLTGCLSNNQFFVHKYGSSSGTQYNNTSITGLDMTTEWVTMEATVTTTATTFTCYHENGDVIDTYTKSGDFTAYIPCYSLGNSYAHASGSDYTNYLKNFKIRRL